MKEGFANISGKKIYYQFLQPDIIIHADYLLLFLHEGLGSAAQWKDFPKHLSDKTGIQALVYDRYGYGNSSAFTDARTIRYLEDEAEFLDCFLKEINATKKLIIVGHSDGGSIALLYASLFSEKVIAVITEAAHVFIEEMSRRGIRVAVDAFENGKLKSALEKYHGEKTVSMFYGWADTWLDIESENWNIEHYLSAIESPCLIVQGENDQYGSYEQVRKIINGLKSPKKELIIPNCAHVPHFEASDFVINEYNAFIKNVLF